MGHHEVEFKQTYGLWRVYKSWQSSAFGYFDHTPVINYDLQTILFIFSRKTMNFIF